MPSLPSLEECHFNANGNSVWTFLLEAEQEALTKSILDQHNHDTPLVAIRVLDSLLKDLWDNARRWNLGDTAYSHMVKKINCIRTGEMEGLTMFGLAPQAESLYGDAFNSLQNVTTLEASMHVLFDIFHLWLELVAGQADTYDVCGPIVDNEVNWATGPLPARIILKVNSAAEAKAAEQELTLSLPDPSLIAIWAICARVSNKSGAAEQMDRILKDLQQSTVLADDGSMAGLLNARLSMISE